MCASLTKVPSHLAIQPWDRFAPETGMSRFYGGTAVAIGSTIPLLHISLTAATTVEDVVE